MYISSRPTCCVDSCLRLAVLALLFVFNNFITRVSAESPDPREIRRLLKNRITSYDQVERYFKQETDIQNDTFYRLRLFPLCVQTSTLEGHPSLQHFASVWMEMESQGCESRPLYFGEYNASLHSMRHNKDWIKSISLSRINTPEVDVRNMRQWMHIKVEAETPLKALYMQPVVGSIGLPSGEFSLEFPCSDAPATNAQDSMTFHCDYRSRAELNHPVAFFGGYAGTKNMTEFHVHYKWTDISCLETPFLQFIMIAIKDFKAGSSDKPKLGVDFQPLLSPVYTNFEFDSRDGAITPYYIDWKKNMTCFKASQDPTWQISTKSYHDTMFQALQWKESSDLDRLFVNEDYEECVTDKNHKDRDENRKECGPGPFQCPPELSIKTVSDQKGFKNVVDRRQQEFKQVKDTMKGCSPCILPNETEIRGVNCQNPTSTSSPLVDAPLISKTPIRPLDPYLYLDYSVYLSASVDFRYHGVLAMFVYLVITPVGILIGRFYRGTPINHVNTDDFWIVIHAVIHLIGLHLLWMSVGFVTTMDEGIGYTAENCYIVAEHLKFNNTDAMTSEWTQEMYMEWIENCTYRSRKNTHSGLGICSFVIHNLAVILSFFRSHTDYIRNIQVIVHSHLGYLDMILSSLTMFYAVEGQHCTEVLAYCIVIAVVTIIAFVSVALISSAEEKVLEIDPPRYKWPILEPVRLSHPGPFYETKMAVLGVYIGIIFFVWLLSVIAAIRVVSSETQVLAGVDDEDGDTINGIFRTCHIPDLFKPNLTLY